MLPEGCYRSMTLRGRRPRPLIQSTSRLVDERSSNAVTASGPLRGIRVIDMTTVMMGPYGTQILADYGADGLKAEPPEGDIRRRAEPMRSRDMGAMYLHANRNKRSIALDAKKEGGRRALLRLCARADV